MSKRDLKKYLGELTKEQIADQFLELYDKFGDVKTYYDFVFNPKEEKLVQESKLKISNEYFPIKNKRAKLRRSVAQKYIKQFIILGVDPHSIVDVMLYNIEVAQRYSAKREMRYASFFKSILNSFEQAINFAKSTGIVSDFNERCTVIVLEAGRQQWENSYAFDIILQEAMFNM